MGATRQIRCGRCGADVAAAELLAGVEWYWSALGVFSGRSPCCGGVEEVRLRDGELTRGYVYAAGAPHFCPVEAYPVAGLRVEHGDLVRVVWDGGQRTVERRRARGDARARPIG